MEGHPQLAERAFQFDVSMSESVREGGALRLDYNFTFAERSTRQVCRIRGKALVRFSQTSRDSDFYGLGDEVQNQMAVEIFRKNYELVYLLHLSLGLEAPSPWITQDVVVSSRAQGASHDRREPTSSDEEDALKHASL
jgi:hypothetical protein